MSRIMKQNKKIEFFIENFMINCKLKELSVKIMDSYEKMLKLFAKYLEEEYKITSIEKIEGEHVKDYLVFTKERGTYSYVTNIKSIVL
ncbi:site-specific integrase [Clostridium uliginosum]|uniref:Integrase/recombinase XerD n=1 Tax=Clostridium uliginosum TaxID=119641 RepID=A0A1I1NI62_9CLOT|nr:site-specific integrase [Clostridium uliginosum]SFC97106.1 integrase/recombinase XerD [Clostridium uliginosum]